MNISDAETVEFLRIMAQEGAPLLQNIQINVPTSEESVVSDKNLKLSSSKISKSNSKAKKSLKRTLPVEIGVLSDESTDTDAEIQSYQLDSANPNGSDDSPVLRHCLKTDQYFNLKKAMSTMIENTILNSNVKSETSPGSDNLVTSTISPDNQVIDLSKPVTYGMNVVPLPVSVEVSSETVSSSSKSITENLLQRNMQHSQLETVNNVAANEIVGLRNAVDGDVVNLANVQVSKDGILYQVNHPQYQENGLISSGKVIDIRSNFVQTMSLAANNTQLMTNPGITKE